ncbi:MAG: hypothetical protein O7G31_11985, partial [Calditrichaeota bacterium]|nr:hypothetical protein [Calditrichota bacterium]
GLSIAVMETAEVFSSGLHLRSYGSRPGELDVLGRYAFGVDRRLFGSLSVNYILVGRGIRYIH